MGTSGVGTYNMAVDMWGTYAAHQLAGRKPHGFHALLRGYIPYFSVGHGVALGPLKQQKKSRSIAVESCANHGDSSHFCWWNPHLCCFNPNIFLNPDSCNAPLGTPLGMLKNHTWANRRTGAVAPARAWSMLDRVEISIFMYFSCWKQFRCWYVCR